MLMLSMAFMPCAVYLFSVIRMHDFETIEELERSVVAQAASLTALLAAVGEDEEDLAALEQGHVQDMRLEDADGEV